MWPLQIRGAGIIADSEDTRGEHPDSCGWEVDSGNTQQGEVAVVAERLADRLEALQQTAAVVRIRSSFLEGVGDCHWQAAMQQTKAVRRVDQWAVGAGTAGTLGREEHCSSLPEQRGASQQLYHVSRRSCYPS